MISRLGPILPRFGERHRATNLYGLKRGDVIVIQNEHQTGRILDGKVETSHTTYELAKVRSVRGHGGRRINGLCVDDYDPDPASDCVDLVTVELFKNKKPHLRRFLSGTVDSLDVPAGYAKRSIDFDMLDRQTNPVETLTRAKHRQWAPSGLPGSHVNLDTLNKEGMDRLMGDLFSRERHNDLARDIQESWSMPHISRLLLRFTDFIQLQGRHTSDKPEPPKSRFSPN